jgi:carboxyl-terminal processing protease
MRRFTRTHTPRWHRPAALLAAAALIVAACGGQAPAGAISEPAAAPAIPARASDHQDLPPATAPAEEATAAVSTPAPPSVADTVQVIGQAYRELTTRLFREVKPSDLLQAGWRGVREEVRRQGAIGVDQLQPYTEAGSADIDAFTRAFTLFVSGPGAGLDSTKLAQAAIRGMTSAVGDSHTRYLTPQQSQSQNRDGAYDGIGVVTSQPTDSDGLLIGEVYAGSPAEQAGLRAGDRIVRVNDADVRGRQQAEVSNEIRGDAGTSVKLTLLSPDGDLRDVMVNRARIIQPVISARMLDDTIGYLKVAQFPRKSARVDAAADFEAALLRLQLAGAQAYVLDLRGNPGGDPVTSVDIASNFIQDGPIFVTVSRNSRKLPYQPNRNRLLVSSPLVVLIDGASASGAEVVASALSEYGVAHLIGTRTCGCLSVGQPLKLDDKSEIIVTVQQALTGRYERSLEGIGLSPDEVVRSSRQPGPDQPLERAIEYLQSKAK